MQETKRPTSYKLQTGEKTAVWMLHQSHVIWQSRYRHMGHLKPAGRSFYGLMRPQLSFLAKHCTFWYKVKCIITHITSLCQGFLWEGPEGLVNTLSSVNNKKTCLILCPTDGEKVRIWFTEKEISILCTSPFLFFSQCFAFQMGSADM